MKKILFILFACCTLVLSSCCSLYGQCYDDYDGVYTSVSVNVDYATIVTLGTPFYFNGAISYYLYNGIYYYPYIWNDIWYFHPYRRPCPEGFIFRPDRWHHPIGRLGDTHHHFRNDHFGNGHFDMGKNNGNRSFGNNNGARNGNRGIGQDRNNQPQSGQRSSTRITQQRRMNGNTQVPKTVQRSNSFQGPSTSTRSFNSGGMRQSGGSFGGGHSAGGGQMRGGFGGRR